jgi:hypothetical protein
VIYRFVVRNEWSSGSFLIFCETKEAWEILGPVKGRLLGKRGGPALWLLIGSPLA